MGILPLNLTICYRVNVHVLQLELKLNDSSIFCRGHTSKVMQMYFIVSRQPTDKDIYSFFLSKTITERYYKYQLEASDCAQIFTS